MRYYVEVLPLLMPEGELLSLDVVVEGSEC